jgi:hypothetical protein
MLAYNKKNLIIKTWDELVNDIADKFQKKIIEITNTVDSDYDCDSNSTFLLFLYSLYLIILLCCFIFYCFYLMVVG